MRKGKTHHQRERREFRHEAEQYVLEDFLSIEEARKRQKTTGPAESIDTGRSHFCTRRNLIHTDIYRASTAKDVYT